MGKPLRGVNWRFLTASFFIWRIVLLLIQYLAVSKVELQDNFLGGGLPNYVQRPYLWSWLNFDGIHYLLIARDGYLTNLFFYFPMFPKMVGLVANIFGRSEEIFAITGLLINHLLFFIALVGLWKLMKLDWEERVIKTVVVLLLMFPTSFYFVSYYTESLFLALVVWSFYFARKKRWLSASILASVASATRIVGLVMLPVLVIEMLLQHQFKVKKVKLIDWVFIAVVPLGLVLYMNYLYKVAGDPITFFRQEAVFGEHRSETLILLPQVFYRYVYKILPNIDYSYFPVVFSTWLEFVLSAIFGGLIGLSLLGRSERLGGDFKLRWSYIVYFGGMYVIPTLSGSFLSMPRFVLVLFPAFIIVAQILHKVKRTIHLILFTILFICLVIASSMFFRGYWLS